MILGDSGINTLPVLVKITQPYAMRLGRQKWKFCTLIFLFLTRLQGPELNGAPKAIIQHHVLSCI